MLLILQIARRATGRWSSGSGISIVLTIVLVVAAASAWVHWALLPTTYMQSKTVEKHRQLAQSAKYAEANAVASLAKVNPDTSPAARSVSLEAPTKETFATLTGNSVSVASMTYQPIAGRSPAGRAHTEINADLEGRYPQIKKALFDILQDHPNIALEAIAVRRTKATNQQLEVQPIFKVFEQ